MHSSNSPIAQITMSHANGSTKVLTAHDHKLKLSPYFHRFVTGRCTKELFDFWDADSRDLETYIFLLSQTKLEEVP